MTYHFAIKEHQDVLNDYHRKMLGAVDIEKKMTVYMTYIEACLFGKIQAQKIEWTQKRSEEIKELEHIVSIGTIECLYRIHPATHFDYTY